MVACLLVDLADLDLAILNLLLSSIKVNSTNTFFFFLSPFLLKD